VLNFSIFFLSPFRFSFLSFFLSFPFLLSIMADVSVSSSCVDTEYDAILSPGEIAPEEAKPSVALSESIGLAETGLAVLQENTDFLQHWCTELALDAHTKSVADKLVSVIQSNADALHRANHLLCLYRDLKNPVHVDQSLSVLEEADPTLAARTKLIAEARMNHELTLKLRQSTLSNQSLSRQLESLKTEKKELERCIKDLCRDMVELKAQKLEHIQATAQLKELKEQVSSLKSAQADADKEGQELVDKLTAEVKLCMQRSEKLREENKDLAREADELEEEKNQALARARELQQQAEKIPRLEAEIREMAKRDEKNSGSSKSRAPRSSSSSSSSGSYEEDDDVFRPPVADVVFGLREACESTRDRLLHQDAIPRKTVERLLKKADNAIIRLYDLLAKTNKQVDAKIKYARAIKRNAEARLCKLLKNKHLPIEWAFETDDDDEDDDDDDEDYEEHDHLSPPPSPLPPSPAVATKKRKRKQTPRRLIFQTGGKPYWEHASKKKPERKTLSGAPPVKLVPLPRVYTPSPHSGEASGSEEAEKEAEEAEEIEEDADVDVDVDVDDDAPILGSVGPSVLSDHSDKQDTQDSVHVPCSDKQEAQAQDQEYLDE